MSDVSTDVDAVASTANKVREMLSSFDDVELHDDGTCSLTYGSAQVVVSVNVFDQDQAVVKVRAKCVTGATLSPELYRHIATFSAELGHLRVVEEADGTATILFSHSLLGEFLNPAELRMTVVALALIADQLDDSLAATYGGQVFNADGNSA
jgi:hypothetical protein